MPLHLCVTMNMSHGVSPRLLNVQGALQTRKEKLSSSLVNEKGVTW